MRSVPRTSHQKGQADEEHDLQDEARSLVVYALAYLGDVGDHDGTEPIRRIGKVPPERLDLPHRRPVSRQETPGETLTQRSDPRQHALAASHLLGQSILEDESRGALPLQARRRGIDGRQDRIDPLDDRGRRARSARIRTRPTPRLVQGRQTL